MFFERKGNLLIVCTQLYTKIPLNFFRYKTILAPERCWPTKHKK